jgi:hypothetical protein
MKVLQKLRKEMKNFQLLIESKKEENVGKEMLLRNELCCEGYIS